jgi:hypothetical protein
MHLCLDESDNLLQNLKLIVETKVLKRKIIINTTASPYP